MSPLAHSSEKQSSFNANIRTDFPIFAANPNLAFLDTAASAQKPKVVLDAMEACYQTYYANVHRGVYKLSQKSTLAYEGVRQKVASFMGATHAEEIVFTKGGTESINLVAQTWGRQNLKAGDVVLISALEHHANIVPWQMLRAALGIELRILPITPEGTAVFEEFTKALEGVKLVALTHMSNAIGTRLPLQKMLNHAREKGITTLVDGCQGIVHGAVDVTALGCDFYTFSAHKLYGPSGVGVLYGRKEILAKMPPYQGGGDMIRTVTFEKTTYADPPLRFEAGTPNIAGVIGLGAAIDYLEGIDFNAALNHEKTVFNAAKAALSRIEGLRIHGASEEGVLSFTIEGVHPHDLGTILDEHNVAIRVGHHCAQPLMHILGVPATARASFGIYNTEEDVKKLVKGIYKAKEMFGV